MQYFNRSPRAFAVCHARLPAHQHRQASPTRFDDQRGLADRPDLESADRRQRRAAGVDERRDGRPHRRERPSRRRACHPQRLDDQRRGAQGSPARRGRLQPQCGHAPPLQRRPAERRQVVDRQRRRYRRGAADGDEARCEDRSAGRSLVVANGFHRRTLVLRRWVPARQRPGAIYVDGTGKRFCNESNSYVEVGKAMYANKAVPCWQIFDEGYVGRYVSGANPFQKRTHPRRTDRAGGRQARRHDRRAGSPDRRSSKSVGGHRQALQRVRGQGPRS